MSVSGASAATVRRPAAGWEAAAAGRRTAGCAALAALVACGLLLVLAAGSRPLFFFVPAGRQHLSPWMAGPLAGAGLRVGPLGGVALLGAMLAAWAAVVACARSLPVRAALAAVVALHLAFALAPPLFSQDIFGYIAFARLGALHGLDPYAHALQAAPADAILHYARWHDWRTPYGPLFTLLTYPLAPLGIVRSLWALKALTALASLGCVAAVWRLARRLGRDPLPAALFVGLNPLLLAYAVGGGHNDPLVLLGVLIAAELALAGRERLAGAAAAAAIAVKLTAGLFVPFLAALAPRRGRALAGVGAAGLAGLALALAVFGSALLNLPGVVLDVQRSVNAWSVPDALVRVLGSGTVGPGLRVVLDVVPAVAVALAVWRAWRGADPMTCAGWATLSTLLTSTWLVPWYVTWVLPFAALSGDRRLRGATLALCAYVIGTRALFYL